MARSFLAYNYLSSEIKKAARKVIICYVHVNSVMWRNCDDNAFDDLSWARASECDVTERALRVYEKKNKETEKTSPADNNIYQAMMMKICKFTHRNVFGCLLRRPSCVLCCRGPARKSSRTTSAMRRNKNFFGMRRRGKNQEPSWRNRLFLAL